MPSVASRSASAGVVGAISTSTNAPSAPMSTASSRSSDPALADAMDRQRVEDLVRDDDAVEWLRRGAVVQPVGQPGRR